MYPFENVTHRQHEAELRQSREECWAREQELAALREKLTSLKTTLDDRRKDVVSYKVGHSNQLCTACSQCISIPMHATDDQVHGDKNGWQNDHRNS